MRNIIIETDVPAKMRDGTMLRADVYRPAEEGPWPVLLMRLPYGKTVKYMAQLHDPLGLAQHGYIVVFQDARGRFASDGDWEPWTFEAEDG
ncbi:CocE/NonD family hydrolase, partial [Klebsiella pneumoniae]|uniref:CocE/NonD family hydrolase n=1 Tax=Klebsiella pneumoniae TaxID=573 RepID=UPI000E696DCE